MGRSQHVFLASASPRRRELLAQIGVDYTLLHAEVDETLRPGESAADYVRRVALEKVHAGRALLLGEATAPVLGADTAVVIDGCIVGKPRDRNPKSCYGIFWFHVETKS